MNPTADSGEMCIRDRDSNKGFFFLMAGLRILAAQGVALYLSEYRDSRGIFTGVLSSMCLLAGMMIPEYLGAAVGYPVWIRCV